jgi:hypothetical protein
MASLVPVVRAAPGVRFDRIAPAGFRILAAFDGLSKRIDRDVLITSGTDSHTSGRHPLGEAFDLSVREWTPSMIVQAVAFLRLTLGARFTVLYEVPTSPQHPELQAIAFVNGNASGRHIHVQPVKGSTYPPDVEPVNSVPV